MTLNRLILIFALLFNSASYGQEVAEETWNDWGVRKNQDFLANGFDGQRDGLAMRTLRGLSAPLWLPVTALYPWAIGEISTLGLPDTRDCTGCRNIFDEMDAWDSEDSQNRSRQNTHSDESVDTATDNEGSFSKPEKTKSEIETSSNDRAVAGENETEQDQLQSDVTSSDEKDVTEPNSAEPERRQARQGSRDFCDRNYSSFSSDWWFCNGNKHMARTVYCDNSRAPFSPSWWRCMGNEHMAKTVECDLAHVGFSSGWWRCMGNEHMARTVAGSD